MKLFRFELAFDGRMPQDIGILRGLDDIGLPEGVSVNIEEDFNELPCPKLSEAVSFWFTEFGVQTFQATLDYLVEQSRELNWQILYAERRECLYLRPSMLTNFRLHCHSEWSKNCVRSTESLGQ